MTSQPPDRPRSAFSRRAFLKSASVVAASSGAAAGISAVSATAAAARTDDVTVVPAAFQELELRINGASRTVRVEPRTTLLDALRDGLDLTGTKKVCDRGACGGCTVMLDGETVNSCMTLAYDAAASDILTIEGLGTPDEPHPMQEAFVACDALQCGFCTPGMIMSAVACVNRRNGKPTDAEMRDDMSGNLCRCGTYTRVFEAIQTTVSPKKNARQGGR